MKSKNIKGLLIGIAVVATMFGGCAKNNIALNSSTSNIAKQVVSRVEGSNSQATPVTLQDNQTAYYFTQADQHPDQQLVAVINSATKTLDVASYSLTKDNIVDAIISAKKRGVQVRIISDKQQSAGKTQKVAINRFIEAGIPVQVNTHSGLMHLKVSIIDNQIATTGSFNYTNNASTNNDEVLVITKSPQSASQFETQFNRMWNDTGDFRQLN